MNSGQGRDGELGLDFFQARYYGAALGRFTSPDPGNAGADLTNPQSWNAYAYVFGNPLSLTDPTGLDPYIAPNAGQPGFCPPESGQCLPFPTSAQFSTVVTAFALAPLGAPNVSYAISLSQLLALQGGAMFSATGYCNGCAGSGSGGGQAFAQPPPKTGTPAPTQQTCVNSFYDSKVGKVVEFGSVLSMLPGWGPNPGRAAAENVFLTGGKLVALRGLQNVAGNQVVPSIVTGVGVSVASPLEKLVSAAAGKILGFAEGAGPIGVGAATVADIMAHGTCAMQADPSLADAALRSVP